MSSSRATTGATHKQQRSKVVSDFMRNISPSPKGKCLTVIKFQEFHHPPWRSKGKSGSPRSRARSFLFSSGTFVLLFVFEVCARTRLKNKSKKYLQDV